MSWNYVNWTLLEDLHALLLLLVVVVVLSLLSPFCRVFAIVYLKLTMFLGYIMLQLFSIYSLCYT